MSQTMDPKVRGLKYLGISDVILGPYVKNGSRIPNKVKTSKISTKTRDIIGPNVIVTLQVFISPLNLSNKLFLFILTTL